LFGRLATIWLIAGVWLWPLCPVVIAAHLSPADVRAGRTAFAAADAGNWDTAREVAAEIGDPLAEKLFFWSDVTRLGGTGSFDAITRFISENPDWPKQAVLRRRAEEAITDTSPPGIVLSWFDRHEPITTEGRVRFGEALLVTGQLARGQATIRDAWVTGGFSEFLEDRFYKTHRHHLTAEDHVSRLDRLIWRGRLTEARRMLGKVDAKYRALAVARLRLHELGRDVDGAIAKVPSELKDDPGLIYERLRWRRKKGRDHLARELLKAHPLDHVNPEKWWAERAILARSALAEGHVSEAYRIARDHALTEGAGFADAEWLAGWIALRFLEEAKVAFDHFTTLFGGVKYPVSRSRGAYWAARAAEADQRPSMAELWYRTAAQHPTTYYGQLAAIRLGAGSELPLPPDPHPSADEVALFRDQELVRAVRMLTEFGQRNRLPPFILSLAEQSDSAGWKALVASLAEEQGRPDLSIAIAKRAIRQGRPLIKNGYPSVAVPEIDHTVGQAAEVPLILAMVRQESAFHFEAVSRAGARGLMQVMPSTARSVAGKLKIPYSRKRLTADPDYNLKIGRSYMSALLETFEGSYVLALAAYNAGPARVKQWKLVNGAPQGNVIDAVDWIELIPFAETRNYVQRTLENLQVYRTMLNGTEVAWTLENDLKR
jgi:soluble lytic murein transglycosylase